MSKNSEPEIELAAGMPEELPARYLDNLAMFVPKKAVTAVQEQKQLIVIGPPIEAAVTGLGIANLVGLEDPALEITLIDANKFMRLRREGDALNNHYDSFEDNLNHGDIVVWSFLSYVSQKIAHEIDTVIASRITENKVNIVTGWNQPPERIQLNKEVRNDFEHGYPLIAHYAHNPDYSYITEARKSS